MPDDVLTFEELRRVQSKERDSDTLTELDEGFFERARNYLELKKEPENPLQGQEYRNARNILQDILDMRQKKIVKLAFLSVKSNVTVDNLLDAEEEMFEELEETIGAYRHDMQEQVFEGRLTVSGSASAGGDMEAGGHDSGEEASEPEAVTSGASTEEPEAADGEDEPDETPVPEEPVGGAEEDRAADDASGEDEPRAGEPGEEVDDDDGGEEEAPDEEASGDTVIMGDGADDADEDTADTVIVDGGDGDEAPGSGAEEAEPEEGDETAEDGEDDGDDRVIFGGDGGEGDEDAADAQEDGETGAGEDDEEREPEEETDEDGGDGEDGGVRVRALQDVNEFMGVDLDTYGPFDEDEEAVVPEKNAEILVDQGKAERVE